jgi:hypothetical protein
MFALRRLILLLLLVSRIRSGFNRNCNSGSGCNLLRGLFCSGNGWLARVG